MARTMHTTARTASERLERISATRHRDGVTRRTTTRSAALAAVLAEYDDSLPPLVRQPSGVVELRGRRTTAPLVRTATGSVELAGRVA